MSGLGAGLDSFFEYLLKAYILFGKTEDYVMFREAYTKIKSYLRRGRDKCTSGHGKHPMYVNVHMKDGSTANTWIDSLQASFAAVQILSGDIEEAVCQHALYYSIWKKYGVLPERFNWHLNAPDVNFYPLRPEFAESTYLLYLTTKNPFYLHVGKDIIDNLNSITKVKCGYATVHNVNDKSLEDRMESFFLSETCKYLYLLFDENNLVNVHYSKLLFTTEGHIFPVSRIFRNFEASPKLKPDTLWLRPSSRLEEEEAEQAASFQDTSTIDTKPDQQNSTLSQTMKSSNSDFCCQNIDGGLMNKFSLPLNSFYLKQLYATVDVGN